MGSGKLKNLVFVFIIFYVFQLGLGTAIIYFSYIHQTKSSLNTLVERVKRDIKYDNGSWDISEYNANPLIPGAFRLYAFSADGFVIDRWRTISGFMDFADFKQLLSYQTPETVETVTDQKWRMYSYPIPNGSDNIIGVISVAIYNPEESRMSEVDEKLTTVAELINSNVIVENGNIDVTNVVRRTVPFDVSFQVVDQYNHILINNSNVNSVTNIPSFVDASYVRREMQVEQTRQIKNLSGSDAFLVETSPIKDIDGESVGVVIAASTLSTMYSIIKMYALITSLVGVVSAAVFGVIVHMLMKRWDSVAAENFHLLEEEDIVSLGFSKDDCLIKINDVSIELLYATNQFYMCEALFSKPKKKWETDELLERFGEAFEKNGWRKVYDAMISINRKTDKVMNQKLIVTNNKTYQINPLLVSKVE